MSPSAGFGIYLHWPFCEAKCPYCDFNSHVVRNIDQDAWLAAYLSEIDRYAAEFPDRILRSVFFGGGTPSLMNPASVDAIIDRITSHWRMENSVEITLEANPNSVELEKFKAFRTAGVTRVSLGVQALNDLDLRKLGRLHSASEALKAMDVARSVFDRGSFDLIYARQDQTLDSWEKELARALGFGFQHMSLYQLTVEEGTAFGDRFANGKLLGLPDEDLSADMYDATVEMCGRKGLDRYEVSNFSVPGQESIHNLIYWNYGDYLGIGPGAHGRLTVDGGVKVATETRLAPRNWLSDVEKGSGESLREPLSQSDQLNEAMLMGLRLADGISLKSLGNLGWSPDESHSFSHLNESGVVTLRNGNLIVEKQYLNVLNTVLDALLNR